MPRSRFVRPAVGYDANLSEKASKRLLLGTINFPDLRQFRSAFTLWLVPSVCACGAVRCKLIGKSEQKAFTGYHQLSGSPAVPRRLYALARSRRLRLRRGTMQTYRKKRARDFSLGIIQFASLRKATLSEKKSTQKPLPRPFGDGDFLYGLEND